MRPTRGRPPSSSTRSSASRRPKATPSSTARARAPRSWRRPRPAKAPRAAGIGVRRALAGQVGREEQALDPRLPVGRAAEQLVVGAPDRLAQPLQRAGRAEHHAHDVPGLRHGVAEGVHARLGVVRVAVQGGEDDAARAEHDGRRAALGHHADAERARGLVARAGGDRHAAVGHAGGWRATRRRFGSHAGSTSSARTTSSLQPRSATSKSSVPEASATSMACSSVSLRRT